MNDYDVEIKAGGQPLSLVSGQPHETSYLPIKATLTPKDPSQPIVELHVERFRNGKPEVMAMTLTVRGPDAPALDSANTRIPLARCLDGVLAQVAAQYGTTDELPQWRTQWQNTRGRRITTEQLEQVALLYRRAVSDGKPPRKEVAERLHVALPTASRLVGQARRAGLLAPPPRPGVAGERLS